jgi:hypothetical protein
MACQIVMPATPQVESPYGDGFGQGRQSPIAKHVAYDEEADPIIGGIAQKIERIGLQRHRSTCEAGRNLD